MKQFFVKAFFLIFLVCFSLEAKDIQTTFKERISSAERGDFIVFHQGGNYTLLHIVSQSLNTLVLEEVTIPDAFAKKGFAWKAWAQQGFAKNTSWNLYEIDLANGEVKSGYSPNKKVYFTIDKEEMLFTKLLSLPLTKVSNTDRKKIGPPPAYGEVDRRSFWNPPQIFEGKKISPSRTDCYRGVITSKNKQLDGSFVDFYFDADEKFHLPYFLEIQTPHFTLKFQVQDTGKNLGSPTLEMPLSPMAFLGPYEKTPQGFEFTLDAPTKFKKFSLMAQDISTQKRMTFSIPCQALASQDGKAVHLHVLRQDMERFLISGHAYIWMALPIDSPHLLAEMPHPIVWEN